jgi:hypothetical protein
MVSITTHVECRAVHKLSFCYLCGKSFLIGEERNRDHLPPKTAFTVHDREVGPVLWLPTHPDCNAAEGTTDQKLGQFIGLRRHQIPASHRDHQLKFEFFPQRALGAITNLDIDQAVWRWVRGFHAALYREHLPLTRVRALTTPFARAQRQPSGPEIEPLKEPQHRIIVKKIKINRAKNNLDIIHTHGGKLRYDCVWCQSDQGRWTCFFALDIYDWVDLGDAGIQPRRGCAGFYMLLPNGHHPSSATRATSTSIIVRNLHPLDPFGP